MDLSKGAVRLTIFRDSSHGIRIVDQARGETLYVCEGGRFKRDTTITRPGGRNHPAVMVGTYRFPSFSSDIDISVPGEPMAMERKGMWSDKHIVQSKRFRWQWEKDRAFSRDLNLVDQSGAVLAQFDNAAYSMSTAGTLTIRTPISDHDMDCVVVTGLAKIEAQKRRARRAGAASAGAVGGGC